MAMTVRDLAAFLAKCDPDLEVVETFTKFHCQAVEQFIDRVSLVKLIGGRTVVAIDGYKHADQYDLEEQ